MAPRIFNRPFMIPFLTVLLNIRSVWRQRRGSGTSGLGAILADLIAIRPVERGPYGTDRG